jgi:hypothetical protein
MIFLVMRKKENKEHIFCAHGFEIKGWMNEMMINGNHVNVCKIIICQMSDPLTILDNLND